MSKRSLDRFMLHPRVLERITLWGVTLRTVRLRQLTSVAELAQRVGVSDETILRMEHGDPSVRIGTYTQALLVLGLLDDVMPEPPAELRDNGSLKQRVRKAAAHTVTTDEYF